MKSTRPAFALIPLFLLSLLVWIPVFFLLGGSLMSAAEMKIQLAPVLGNAQGYAQWSLLPHYPTLRAYVELFLDSPAFFVMFWNSVKIAAGITAGQMAVGVPAAWAFAQYNFPGKKALFTLYMVLMLMPFQVTMVSSYLVLDKLSLLDTLRGIILPGIFSTFPVFIIYRFFKAIPRALIQAAELDGAGPVAVFLRIGVPLGAPGILSAMVLAFLEYWNIIEQPLIFLQDKTRWPLSLYLPGVSLEGGSLAFAASVVTLIPAALVFLFGQSYLEQGIVASGVKE